jgi:hypothetical protein
MKTLAVILHHNTVKYTNDLYELLAPDQKSGDYNLIVVDNGSDPSKQSEYTTFKLDRNVYFGGALNACMEMMMENPNYDSLLFLNNDLIVGNNFVKGLRETQCACDDGVFGYDVVTPSIIQPELTQNHWKQMLNWASSKPRRVQWIDLQCPLLSRRFVQNIHNTVFKTEGHYIDPLMIRGWGIDVWFGVLCDQQGWKTCVCDHVPAIHLGSMTMKAMNNVSEYCRLAEQGMFDFFQKNGMMKEFTEMRKWAEEYTYPNTNTPSEWVVNWPKK